MPVQSEAALENGLIDTLQKMNYEYVHIEEEKNLSANFKKQLEKHNKKKLEELGRTEFTEAEFEKILIYLEGGTRFEKAKKLRDLFPLELESGERLSSKSANVPEPHRIPLNPGPGRDSKEIAWKEGINL